MRVKIFTFRYSPTLGSFDDGPLLEFTRDKEVLSFREHFFTVSEVPHLACVVTYQEAVVAGVVAPPRQVDGPRGRGQTSEFVSTLPESERILFGTLREWRARRARQEGVPPYVIFTNRELVELLRRRPESATALGHVPGIGPGKVEKYGRDILVLLHGTNGSETQAALPASTNT
ncbi:MAG: HRDC domain-containing protein [Planctomycetes bacterium]|nr:HRDC domain-containing protein [Planctomycetota bacterium]